MDDLDEVNLVPKRKTTKVSKPIHPPGRRVERRVVHERCPVIVTIAADGLEYSVSGIATDVGPRGIGLITDNPVAQSSTVYVTLKSKLFTHEMKARVIWCRELPSCGKIIKTDPIFIWRVGLLFQPEDEDDRKLLQHIFEQL